MRVRVLPRVKLITINRGAFELRLWRRGISNSYTVELRRRVALGLIGHETPTGTYWVQHKTRKPDWLAPDAEWVPEEMRGEVFRFEDPRNPFAGGFISIAGPESGIGIHGTKFDPEVGTAASHGCIRMLVEDLDLLYTKVAIGTPVFLY
jgi:lipoprotein-anchoring transpeptidase ErfK/SrfK